MSFVGEYKMGLSSRQEQKSGLSVHAGDPVRARVWPMDIHVSLFLYKPQRSKKIMESKIHEKADDH